jgi:hypothetical protein
MSKISFDFDSCLSTKRVQEMAKIFISAGFDVYVTTSRFASTPEILAKWPWIGDQNLMLFEITDELGIPREKIRFTTMIDKWTVLDGFDIHFDDDETEIELIKENLPNCEAILIYTPYIYE